MSDALADLQITLAHQAHTIDELSDEVRRQGDQIDRLVKTVRSLTEQFQALEDSAAPAHEITKPPHY